VLAALNATIQALGLPSRYHLRAEKALTGDNVDPALQGPDVPEYMKEGLGPQSRRRLKALHASRRRRLQEEMTGVGELGGQQECGRSELFVAYVVSDWKNVTDAVARAIRSPEAEGLLTRLLQERADADAAVGLSPLAVVDYAKVYGASDGEQQQQPQDKPAVPATPPAVCTLVAYRTASIHIPAASIAGISNGTCRGGG